MNGVFVFVMALPLVIIIGGLIMGAMALHHHAQLKQLAYRERIAMIERGLTPPPEVDPQTFERTVGATRRVPAAGLYGSSQTTRYRSAGITVLAIGLGCLMIITFAAEAPAAGVGVGGAIMVLGAALLLNAYLGRYDQPFPAPPPRQPAPPPPPQETQGPTI